MICPFLEAPGRSPLWEPIQALVLMLPSRYVQLWALKPLNIDTLGSAVLLTTLLFITVLFAVKCSLLRIEFQVWLAYDSNGLY